MSEEIKIRKAKPADLDICLVLAQEPELASSLGVQPTYEELRNGLRHGIFMVAKLGDTVVGFVLGYVMSRQNGHIDLLVVAKEHRRKGIGTKLSGKIVKKMRKKNVNWIWLIAHETDADMNFYNVNHFKEGDRFRLFWRELS